MKEKVKKIECKKCRGTGAYVGYMQLPGTAVVCQACNGTGFILRKLFHRRKYRPGIANIINSEGYSIPYEEFFNGKFPGSSKS